MVSITPFIGETSAQETFTSDVALETCPSVRTIIVGIAHAAMLGKDGIPPAGLVLKIEPAHVGQPDAEAAPHETFRVIVVDKDHAPLMELGPFPEEDIVAVWRAMSRDSGLPLMIERANGDILCPFPQMGRVRLGEIHIRRRYGLLNGRRPRFLVRRKTGLMPSRPRIHRKAEIVSGMVS
jgi:hypothetical protein